MCHSCAAHQQKCFYGTKKIGQIVRRGARTWLVRVYNGRDPETKTRSYLNHTVYGGLRDAQAHLNKMLGERDRGRNLDSSKQTLNDFLDRWLELCAQPRLRAKSFSRLRRPAAPIRAAGAWPESARDDICARHPSPLSRLAGAKSVSSLDRSNRARAVGSSPTRSGREAAES